MDCVVCGCTQEVEIHGHTQCSKCGRILDGDCCQGSQQSDTKDKDWDYRIENDKDCDQ